MVFRECQEHELFDEGVVRFCKVCLGRRASYGNPITALAYNLSFHLVLAQCGETTCGRVAYGRLIVTSTSAS